MNPSILSGQGAADAKCVNMNIKLVKNAKRMIKLRLLNGVKSGYSTTDINTPRTICDGKNRFSTTFFPIHLTCPEDNPLIDFYFHKDFCLFAIKYMLYLSYSFI